MSLMDKNDATKFSFVRRSGELTVERNEQTIVNYQVS